MALKWFSAAGTAMGIGLGCRTTVSFPAGSIDSEQADERLTTHILIAVEIEHSLRSGRNREIYAEVPTTARFGVGSPESLLGKKQHFESLFLYA
jgi:hypothetical protein